MALIILRSVFVMVAIGLVVVIITSGVLPQNLPEWVPTWLVPSAVFLGVLLLAAGAIVGDILTPRKKLETISAVYF